MKGLTIREARIKDAEQISYLLDELGYPNSRSFSESKIRKLSKSNNDVVVVAVKDNKVVGVAHLHNAELFHEMGKIGRIMAIVIDKNHQRIGVGKRLTRYLEKIARDNGCAKMEVTDNIRRNSAHEFYQKLGYLEKPKRFIKIF